MSVVRDSDAQHLGSDRTGVAEEEDELMCPEQEHSSDSQGL